MATHSEILREEFTAAMDKLDQALARVERLERIVYRVLLTLASMP